MHIDVNGISIFYETRGSGSPLILLHGNGEDHHIFDKLADRLAADYTVYALDSRNHGQSQNTDDYSYETMAEDTGCFIQALGLDRPGLVGFSDGAITGLLLAMKQPRAISRLALLGINLKPDDFTEECYQYVKDTYQETKDPLFKLMLEQPCIELEDVRTVDVPVLLVLAEHDLFRPETFPALASALPNAQLKIMAGHDHDSYIANQDLLYPDLTAFFHLSI